MECTSGNFVTSKMFTSNGQCQESTKGDDTQENPNIDNKKTYGHFSSPQAQTGGGISKSNTP